MKNIKAENIKNILIALLLLSSTALSGTGKVQLYEEHVSIRIDKNLTAHVLVKFIFKNTLNYSSTLAFPVSEWIRMEHFTALWNNVILDCELFHAPENKYFLMAGEDYRSVYRFNVPQTVSDISEHIVSYSYKIPHISFIKDYGADGYYIEYILRTGSLWHGNMERLNITVTSDIPLHDEGIMVLDNSFAVKCTGPNRWEFTGRDIGLTKNIRLLLKF